MRRVLFVFLAVVVATLLGTAWYAYHKGFTSKWRGIVTNEFRSRGLEVSLRKLTLDPLRGIVAKDVRVYETRQRKRTVAFIDEMILQVNLANLARGKTFIDALDLRDASLSLQLDPANSRGPRIEISKLNARLFLPPQQIFLARADAVIFGMHVHADGRLVNPQAIRLKPGARGDDAVAIFGRIADEVAALKFEAGPPLAGVTFSGDLAHPEKIALVVTLKGEKIRRKNYRLANLRVAADLRNGTVDLKEFTARDEVGELQFAGTADLSAKTARIHIRSTLDSLALLRAFDAASALGDVVLYSAPEIETHAKFSFGGTPAVAVIGHLSLGKFAYRSVVVEGGSADFSTDGERWALRDVSLVHRTGTVTGDIQQVPGDFRARLNSTINPNALRPLVTGRIGETLAQFEFPHSTSLALEAAGTSPTSDTVIVTGEVNLDRAIFRGVTANSPQSAVRYENGVLSIAPFRADHADQWCFDFRSEEARFENVERKPPRSVPFDAE